MMSIELIFISFLKQQPNTVLSSTGSREHCHCCAVVCGLGVIFFRVAVYPVAADLRLLCVCSRIALKLPRHCSATFMALLIAVPLLAFSSKNLRVVFDAPVFVTVGVGCFLLTFCPYFLAMAVLPYDHLRSGPDQSATRSSKQRINKSIDISITRRVK